MEKRKSLAELIAIEREEKIKNYKASDSSDNPYYDAKQERIKLGLEVSPIFEDDSDDEE